MGVWELIPASSCEGGDQFTSTGETLVRRHSLFSPAATIFSLQVGPFSFSPFSSLNKNTVRVLLFLRRLRPPNLRPAPSVGF